MYKLAQLQNWPIGSTVAVTPNSEVVQWILDAVWFNWNVEHRIQITRDVEASDLIWLTPTRLGVMIQFCTLVNGEKTHARVFIELFDRRIIKPDIFSIQTYKELFEQFLRDLNFDDVSLTLIISFERP